MIAPTLVGLTSICLSLPNIGIKSKTFRFLLIFTPIFIFLALRYNYGNDFPGYLATFKEIASLYEMDYDPDHWHDEVGWLFLNRLFSRIGFFPMIAVLAFFNCYIYARFISRYVPGHYYWLAVFFYLFNPENMLIQSSAMRQAVAISFFILATESVIKKNLIGYFVAVGLASLFHTSALLLIPVYFIGVANISIRKRSIPIFLTAYISLFFFSEEIVSIMLSSLISEGGGQFERYVIYDGKGTVGSGVGLLFHGLYLILLLYFYEKQSNAGKFFFKMSISSIYLVPFSVEVLMLARIGYYFSVFSIISIPLIAVQIEKQLLRICFVVLHILYALWAYFQFFQNPIWKHAFSEYQTVLRFIF